MEKGVFRKSSLDRISSPEQLNEYIKVASPAVWMIISALILLVIAGLVWGFLGSMPTTVSTAGVLFPDHALVNIQAEGTVGRAAVSAGAHVAAGDTVAILSDGTEVVSAQAGTVVSVLTAGESSSIGAPVASILPDDIPVDTVICYYPATEASLPVGAKAQVSLGSAPRDSFGYINGTVLSVGTYPVTTQDAVDTLGNAQLVQSLLNANAQVKVVIALETSEETGGALNPYAWSSQHGQTVTVTAGTLCDVLIITEVMRPIDYLLGH